MNEATVVVQGFGNAGQFAAQLVEEQGAKIIAVSDTQGAIINKNGFTANELIKYKHENKTVSGFPGSTEINNEELFTTGMYDFDPSRIGESDYKGQCFKN